MKKAHFAIPAWATLGRIIGLIAVGLFPLPTTAAAQTLVRTGEHQGFSRMVIDFAERPEWRLGRVGNGYELRTDTDGRFDLSDVFRRLDAGRLAKVRDAGDGVIAFEVGCRCRLKVFELPNQGLVIDIVDGTPPQNNPFEVALDQSPAKTPPRRALPVATLPVLLSPQPPSLDYAALTMSKSPVADAPQTDEVRRALIEQLSHGMTQGLIDLRDPLPKRARDHAPTVPSERAPSLKRPDPSSPNLSIETQFDRDLRESGGGATRVSEASCLAASRVDVGGWFNADLVIVGTGAARMNLFDARDRPDAAAHATLARQLLYLSFGAEARSVLRSGPDDIRDAALLDDIALIIDGGVAPPDSPLHDQLECETPAAVWALLSQTAPVSGAIARNAVMSTLSAWPSHLRRHLGPRVSAALLSRGDRDGALAIRNAIERGAPATTDATTMMVAQLELDGGERWSAEAKLQKVAESKSDKAAQAMVALLDSQMSYEAPVAANLIDNARALAFEVRETDMAASLWAASVRAQIHNAQVKDALLNLRDGQGRGVIAQDVARSLREAALTTLTRQADDASFLRIALSELDIAPATPPARLLIAERLATLRMPAQARMALGDTKDVPTPRERILRARIALLDDEPRIAESYLAGLGDPEALALLDRARALPDASIPAAVPSELDAEPEPLPGVLAANRTLLDESRAQRQKLNELLLDEF